MYQIIAKEPMTYKKQKKDNELLVKLRIIKDRKYANLKVKEICYKYSVHRNTVRNIINKFETLDKKTKSTLLKDTLTKDEIFKYLGCIRDKPPKPKSHPKQATPEQEEKIIELHSRMTMGPKRMANHIKHSFRKPGNKHRKVYKNEKDLLRLTVAQIKGIYKRNRLKSKTVRSKTGERRNLYDYKLLGAFENMHYDVKYLADSHALPEDIYEKFKLDPNLPLYMWNIIDAKSRFRFISYSNHLGSEFGRNFLHLVIQYIRSTLANWDTHITIGTDNGSEFYGGSKRKEEQWNTTLKFLNAHIYSYEPGFDIRKNLIERSHRTDDEEFLIPRGPFIYDKESFLDEARDYMYYFNAQRSHSGIEMHNRTPLKVLQDAGFKSAHKLLNFPTMILEDNSHLLSDCYSVLELSKFTEDYFIRKEDITTIDEKSIRDWIHRLPFFTGNAQKVLTHYHSLFLKICSVLLFAFKL